ncbi:MAG: metallophosphoesterase [Haloarculaceae archaeon]
MDVTYVDRAASLDETLVVADLHLGREATMGVQVSTGGDEDVRDRLLALLDRFDPETVVLAGDVLHSFEEMPAGTERVVGTIHDRILDGGARAVVTPGNHDVALDAVWPGETTDAYRVGDTVICHGHRTPDVDADRYVVGHDHPTLVVEGRKRPCYLEGETVDGDALVMLPAFDRLTAGVPLDTVTTADLQSPLLASLESARPVVWDADAEETLRFPALSQFREML